MQFAPPIEWGAESALRLISLCESKRLWKAHSPIHDKKKTPYRLARERADQNEVVAATLEKLGYWKLSDLAMLLLTTSNPFDKEMILEAMLCKIDLIESDAILQGTADHA